MTDEVNYPAAVDVYAQEIERLRAEIGRLRAVVDVAVEYRLTGGRVAPLYRAVDRYRRELGLA